jgi:uncharacterized membrane protein (DUF373 family)
MPRTEERNEPSLMRAATEIQRPVKFMEALEKYGYLSAGLSFLLLGMAVFAYGWVSFARSFQQGLPAAVLGLMNDLLLVVILLELFRTVINFLKDRTISLEPFLHVGIIAAVRRVLTIGAQMAVTTQIPPEEFRLLLLDILVNAGVVLALVVGLYVNRLARTRRVELSP